MLVSEQSLSHSAVKTVLPDPGLLPGPLSPVPVPNPGLPNVIASRQEVAFIDGQIQEYQKLLPGIRRGVEVVILDPQTNGLNQITEVLAQKTELSAIHIISYGDTGKLYLGNSQLSVGNLAKNANTLAVWQQSLLPGADVLLYGSNIAAGDVGNQFIQDLSKQLGADIAASDDVTGKASLQGDWRLEVQTAPLATSLAVRNSVLQAYDYTLSAPPAMQAWKDWEPTPPIAPPPSLSEPLDPSAALPEIVAAPPALEAPSPLPNSPTNPSTDPPNLSSNLPDPVLALPSPPPQVTITQELIPEVPTGELLQVPGGDLLTTV